MLLLKVSILYWVPLLLLLYLLPENTAATSSSLAPSPSTCEAVDADTERPSWEQIEANVGQAVAGVSREVASLIIFKSPNSLDFLQYSMQP